MGITLEDFMKMDLRIAEILSVAPHPNADRLYLLEIRVGETVKQIVAGIRAFYTEEQLKGKKVLVVNNLQPATIRGVESQGMLLVASEGDQLSLMVPERDLPSGARVK
jgi:methionyl-tRNA synthetase